jgi:uncharacterized protein
MSDADARLAPVAATERVVLLDVLRGFALYGVLVANTAIWFSGIGFLPRAEREALATRWDDAAALAIRLLVDAKAMTVFAFLFGVGFAIQLDRAAARGDRGLAIYLRRLVVLFGLGVAHVVLLWWGDILTTYALVGAVMVLFRNARPRTLLIAAALLVFVPQLLFAIPAVAAAIAAHTPGPTNRAAFRAAVLDALHGHDPVQLAKMQGQRALVYGAQVAFFAWPWTLGRFLVGYAAGKSGVLRDASARLPFFRRLLVVGLVVGVACSAGLLLVERLQHASSVLPAPAAAALVVPRELAALGLAAAYVAAVTLLMQRPAWARRLLVLAPVGQMALTSYLLQSLLCTFVFYGWGLGLIGRVGAALCIPITIVIYVAEIALAHWWLRRFRFGPAEWLWRSLTYGRRQPMRR